MPEQLVMNFSVKNCALLVKLIYKNGATLLSCTRTFKEVPPLLRGMINECCPASAKGLKKIIMKFQEARFF